MNAEQFNKQFPVGTKFVFKTGPQGVIFSTTAAWDEGQRSFVRLTEHRQPVDISRLEIVELPRENGSRLKIEMLEQRIKELEGAALTLSEIILGEMSGECCDPINDHDWNEDYGIKVTVTVGEIQSFVDALVSSSGKIERAKLYKALKGGAS